MVLPVESLEQLKPVKISFAETSEFVGVNKQIEVLIIICGSCTGKFHLLISIAGYSIQFLMPDFDNDN